MMSSSLEPEFFLRNGLPILLMSTLLLLIDGQQEHPLVEEDMEVEEIIGIHVFIGSLTCAESLILHYSTT